MDTRLFGRLAVTVAQRATRRRFLAGAALATAGVATAGPAARAANPHCVGDVVCVDEGTELRCSGKIAGLANEPTTIRIEAEGTATKRCKNRGGNYPPGQTEEIEAGGEITVTPGNTGQLTFRNLFTEEPDVTDTCPGPQEPEVTDVQFTDATIFVEQGGQVVATCDVDIRD